MSEDAGERLRKAAGDGDLACLEAALAAGARPDARGEFGDTALNFAARNGHAALVERLLAAGADVENVGGADQTPLMNAAYGGHVRTVRLLLERGARVGPALLAGLETKVRILEENVAAGMVDPAAVDAWRGFLEALVEAARAQQA